MNVIAFDTETEKTRPGCKAPPMACLTFHAKGEEKPSIVHGRDPAARRLFVEWIESTKVTLAGHFTAYDMGVAAVAWPDLIPAIFDAYEADRVECTMLREKLWDIALGTFRGYADEKGVWRRNDYNLDAVARRRANMPLKKDGWRKRYGEFIAYPLEQWPARASELAEEARRMIAGGIKDKDLEAIAKGDPNEVILYPLNDATATLLVREAQEALIEHCDPNPFVDQYRQSRASWWLTLMCNWGLRTRAEGVRMLTAQTKASLAGLEKDLVAAGLVRPDGSANTKVAKARMLEVMGWAQEIHTDANGKKSYSYTKTRDDARKLHKTDTGDVSIGRDACKASEDPILGDYGERSQLQSVLSKDVPMLEAGVFAPVHTRIDIAASGRTTSSSPNIQNLRRLPGIREAFVPRDGFVYAQADYPGLELRTLAQVCFDLFGYSALGDMLNRGEDPHLAFAARALGISYEEAKKNKKRKDVDDMRQVGKVFNFGKPGGLGARERKDGADPTLIQFARKTYGVHLTIEQVAEYSKTWLETLPEMRDFHAYVRRLCDNPKKEATILQLRSLRIRGGCSFTAGCNTWFQGLGADATKDAGFVLAKTCFTDRESPLFGSRTAAYIHDEFIVEVPERREGNSWPHATRAARELGRIMRDVANRWLPNVPFTEVDALLMRLWSKDAEAIEDADGNLVPWEPALAGTIKMGEALAKRHPSPPPVDPSLRVAA